MTARKAWGTRYWRTFSWGGDDYTLFVNGAAVTAPYGDLEINETLSNDGARMTFTIWGTMAQRPQAGARIDFNELLNFTATDKLIFSGRVVNVRTSKIGGAEFAHDVECADWLHDINRTLVAEVYDQQEPSAILAHLQANYTDGSYNLLAFAGPWIDGTPVTLVCKYEPVGEVIRRLFEVIRFDWWIDYKKNLRVMDTLSGSAEAGPMSITDANYEFDDFVLSSDSLNLKTSMTVRGGYYLPSTPHTQTVTAQAGSTAIQLDYVPHSPTVTINAVSKTIGIRNVDGDKDFYYDQREKTLTVGDYNGGAFAGGETVVLAYYYEIPVIVQVRDNDAITLLDAIEGGSGNGVREGYIEDKSLVTLDDARRRGYAELAKWSQVTVSCEFRTIVSGLEYHFRPGQLVTVNLTDRGLSGQYLVYGVRLSYIGAGRIEQTVQVATYARGYNEALRAALYNRDYSTNTETIDKLELVADTATASETTTVEALRQPPFKWGPDANPLIWNEGEWA